MAMHPGTINTKTLSYNATGAHTGRTSASNPNPANKPKPIPTTATPPVAKAKEGTRAVKRLTHAEAAATLGVSERTLRRLRNTVGKLYGLLRGEKSGVGNKITFTAYEVGDAKRAVERFRKAGAMR